MIDADRHRIWRKFIRVRYKTGSGENSVSDTRRHWCQRSDDLMANALAAITSARRLIIRSGLSMFRLPLLAMRTAIGK